MVSDQIFTDCGWIIEEKHTHSLPSNNQEHQWALQNKDSAVINVEPQEKQHQEKKKKCRGNRKLQRYRRRLRAKGLDPATVANLEQMTDARQIDEYNNEMETDVVALPIDQVFPFHSNSKSEYKLNL